MYTFQLALTTLFVAIDFKSNFSLSERVALTIEVVDRNKSIGVQIEGVAGRIEEDMQEIEEVEVILNSVTRIGNILMRDVMSGASTGKEGIPIWIVTVNITHHINNGICLRFRLSLVLYISYVP